MLTDILDLLIGIYAVQFFAVFVFLLDIPNSVITSKKEFFHALIPFSWMYNLGKIIMKSYNDLP